MSKQNQQVASKLIKITILSFLFMAAQFIGGYLAHSVAIWSDAFHLLSDVLAYAISLIAVILSEKRSPSYLTFGWLKAQTLGALLNVIFIYLVTIQLFIEATHRMIKKDKVEEPKYMLITSVFGLICNLIVLSILHNDPNGGHSGCSHHQKHSHFHGAQASSNHFGSNNTQRSGSKYKNRLKKQSCNHDHLSHNLHLHQDQHQSDQHHRLQQREDHLWQEHQGEHHLQQEHQGEDHLWQEHQGEHKNSEKGCCHSKQFQKSKSENWNDQVLSDTSTNIPKIRHQMEHSDEQIYQPQNKHSSKTKNINLEAAYIHIITDIILSIGVIIAALIIYFLAPENAQWSPWHLADPLCTYLFSLLAIYSTWPILKESLLILLDGCDDPHLLSEIEADLLKIQGVKQIKEIKLWSLNRGSYYAGVKIKVQKDKGSERIKGAFAHRGIQCFVEVEHQSLELSN